MRKAAVLLSMCALAGCSASRASFEAGKRSALERDWERAVIFYEAAARAKPDNVEYRIALLRARLEASHVQRRERAEPRAEATEPVVERLQGALLRLSVPSETSLRSILESLAKLAGVNILFDESYRDHTITVDLSGVTFEQALELLTRTNGLFYKVIGSSEVEVTPERR